MVSLRQELLTIGSCLLPSPASLYKVILFHCLFPGFWLYPQLISRICVCRCHLPIHLITSHQDSQTATLQPQRVDWPVPYGEGRRHVAISFYQCAIVCCWVAHLLSLTAGAFHTSVATSNGGINSQQPPPASFITKYEPLDSTCCKHFRWIFLNTPRLPAGLRI